MSEREKNRRVSYLLAHGSGIVLGALATLTAIESDADQKFINVYRNITSQNSDSNYTPEVIIITKPLASRTLLENQPLSQEVIKEIKKSLVFIEINLVPGYESYGFLGELCSGFVTRDSQGIPLITTARHCIPDAIRSRNDGKTYPTYDSQGQSILKIRVLDSNNNFHDATSYNYYIPDAKNPRVPDVTLLQVSNPSLVLTKGLPLNLEPLQKGDRFYRVNTNQNRQVTTTNLNFLGEMDLYMRNFVDLGNPASSCIPGTSGSPIVNNEGEVVAVTDMVGTYQVTKEMADKFDLEGRLIGKQIISCLGTSSKAIQGLIRNP